MRFTLALFALCLAVPAAAQTYVSPVKLNDADGDGKVRLTRTTGPYRSGQTITYCPEAAPHTYVRGLACPVVTPPVVVPPVVVPPVTPPPPPPPVVEPEPPVTPKPVAMAKVAASAGEVFMQGRHLSIGVNEGGGIGTKRAAPAGFTTDAAKGLLRLGMLPDPDGFGAGKAHLDDAILQGRSIEGFNVGYKIGGKAITHANQLLTSLHRITGVSGVAAPGVAGWSGTTAERLLIDQRVTLADDARFVRVDVTLTNEGAVPMTDVRYMRTVDPDQDDIFATANRVVRQGPGEALVTAGLGRTGASFFLYGRGAARASFYGFVNADPYLLMAHDVPQPAGTAKTVDQTLNLVFGLGELAPGEAKTVTLYMGVTTDVTATVSAIGADR